MRCADCKYFGKTKEADWKPPKPGWGFCEAVATQGDEDPHLPQSLAMAIDAESYHAELAVSPEFGCIQFAPEDLSTPRDEMLTPTGRRDYAP